MTQEQAALLKAMLRANLDYLERGAKTDAVMLNKAVTGFSLRTAQALTSHGIGTITKKGESNFISLYNYPERK